MSVMFTASALAAPADKRQGATIPQYVLSYGERQSLCLSISKELISTAAPLVRLHSQDPYKPSDIGAQVANTKPELNFNVISGQYDLNNLDSLNNQGGADVYLTSQVDITTNPAWLNGVAPDSTGKTNNAITTVIITTDTGNGVLDAFYMYFYAYNW
jgi:hypothetical protein